MCPPMPASERSSGLLVLAFLTMEVSLKTHKGCNVSSLTWCVKLMGQSLSYACQYGGSFCHHFLLNATLHFRFLKKMSFILLSSFSLFSAITD